MIVIMLNIAIDCCVIEGVGLDPTKPPPKKAKQLRLERRLAKRSQSAAAAAVENAETLPVSVSNSITSFCVHS